MFGFMERDDDYGKLIQSIDTLMPYITISQVAPRWIRPLIMSPALFSRAKEAVTGLNKLWIEAGIVVADRNKILKEGSAARQDILGQLFEIYHEKGAKLDYELIDIQQEIRGAL